MRKTYNLKKLANKRSYSSDELSETLNVHLQTIRDWRRSGMKPLPDSKSPYLFLGSEVKRFLHQEWQKQRVKLQADEFYCVACHKAVKPELSSIKLIEREKILGGGKQATVITSYCPICERKVNRFSSQSVLSEVETIKQPEIIPKNEPSREVRQTQTKEEQQSLFDVI